MPFIYKALSDGTLSNPYRHVKKDDVVILQKELEKPSAWLKPHDPAAPVAPPPEAKPPTTQSPVFPRIHDPLFEASMKPVLERERLEDEKAKALINGAAAAQQPESAPAGVGNQDVLS